MDHFIESLTAVVPTKQQLAWQQLEFTAFFHYGINSFTNREWGTGQEDIAIFDPKHLDVNQWCESLVKAGIKACIITAKHHDGFCLWDTKYTNHSVMHTPCKQDIVALLSRACKKHGLKFGIYLSPWDRHEGTYGQGVAYDDYFCNQLEELMTNYGELYTLWFDGACGEGPNGKVQQYDWDRYYRLIRALQPNAVISVSGPDTRWCGNEAGDCRPSEWSVVPARLFSQAEIAKASQQSDDAIFRERRIDVMDMDLGSRAVVKGEELIWYPAEVNTSIRPGWFYHEEEDGQVKSLDKLIDIYMNSVGGNGLFLLNIPPHYDGYLTEYDVTRLEEIGAYLQEAFSNNQILEAKIDASDKLTNFSPENVAHTGEDYWKCEDWCEHSWLEFTWDEARNIKYVVLQEDISQSQRVETFRIYGKRDGIESVIYEGTTIGYKKICLLDIHKMESLKICFEQFRKSAIIKTVGIY